MVDEKYLSIDDAAKRLGVSPWTIRHWAKERTIASIKLGRRRVIANSEIDRVIAEAIEKAKGEA
jgi:excisionase family DNA binding protein